MSHKHSIQNDKDDEITKEVLLQVKLTQIRNLMTSKAYNKKITNRKMTDQQMQEYHIKNRQKNESGILSQTRKPNGVMGSGIQKITSHVFANQSYTEGRSPLDSCM